MVLIPRGANPELPELYPEAFLINALSAGKCQ